MILQLNKSQLLITILVILYSVGLIGLTTSLRPSFLPLSSINLFISFILLLISFKKHDKILFGFITLGFTIGMIAEWIGVHTNLLFGDYQYGDNLGPSFFGVPIIIGFNWVMLCIISGAIATYFNTHWIVKALIGTFLMLSLDMLIEPIAIISDYWVWNGEIPVSNFIGWFFIALLIQMLYFSMKIEKQNKVAVVLYCIQFLFFLILNFVL